MDITPATGVILGSALGAIYFYFYEAKTPRESSCTYLSPWTTDLFAWLGGSWLVHRSYIHDDWILAFIGMTAASLHVAQFAAHKVIEHRILTNAEASDEASS
jgi:hypothetical protein